MKVITNISKIDLICFNLALLPTLRSTYVSILIVAMFVFGFICCKNGFPQTQNNWIAILVGSLGGGFFGVLFGVAVSMISILLMSSSKNGVLGEHEYTISLEGFHEKTSANEGLSNWSGITKVKVAGSYLLFQISGYLFHIVPARSFNAKEDFNEFVSSSMEYWQNAHNKRVN
ncbi:YcxB family protein [Teredinibacter turnerae]|uniref:YcxB family protein n=1 Tax=Teredinibacter turnerae TaxID=2426 RepID=UPI00036FCF2D|nr:YcxB family protein [Teredinibacter turnerae]